MSQTMNFSVCRTLFQILYCVILVCSVSSSSEYLETANGAISPKSKKSSETTVPSSARRSVSSSSEEFDCVTAKACDDPGGYEAIRNLHRQLDDDANGSIDVSETDGFLRDELQYQNGRHKERHKEFHGNDKYINVAELWQAWKTSEVHNWTVEETVEWLINQVDLPQYEPNFRNKAVTGAFLPLLAQNSHNYISHNLSIKDSIHKQKISLKAMDIVLFGKPKSHNYVKDAVLVSSLMIAVGGCWFAYVQHKRSQTHMHRMMKDMEALQNAEDSLRDLQTELNKARLEQEIVSIEKQDLERRLQDEIITAKRVMQSTSLDSSDSNIDSRILELERELTAARHRLRDAEKQLEARHWVAPLELQHWLQLTHELEQRNLNVKRLLAEQQLQAAKEGCEKLSKKRATFMGAFRIAHGSSIDDVDDRIVKAKSAVYEVTTDLQEQMQRWKQIENLCGFQIILNPGIACLESILKANGTTAAALPGINTLSKSSSATTLQEDNLPPYASVITAKPIDRQSFCINKRFLVHRDSGISLTAVPIPVTSTTKEVGPSTSVVPPPTYSKSSPSLVKQSPIDIPCSSKIGLRPIIAEPLPLNCTTDGQTELPEDDCTDRSITPPSMASCPEVTSTATFILGDRLLSESIKAADSPSETHSNGKFGEFARKISASILDKKKKPPTPTAIEALKKSASSSNIADSCESSDSSSVISEEKTKKKKFFQTLRHRKSPKS